MLRFAEAFPKQALQLVSTYRCRYLLARYRKPQTGEITLFFTYQDRDTGVSTAEIILKYLLKFESSRQSQPSRERFADCRTHVYGVRRALPFARRALITPRPPRVCIRARKPCVLARLILLG